MTHRSTALIRLYYVHFFFFFFCAKIILLALGVGAVWPRAGPDNDILFRGYNAIEVFSVQSKGQVGPHDSRVNIAFTKNMRPWEAIVNSLRESSQ